MKKLVLSLASLIAFGAQASTITSTVSVVYKMGNGVAQVQMAGTTSGHPSCGSANNSRFTIDTSTNAGKQQIATIEQAGILKALVTIVGTNTCPPGIHPNIENIDHLYIAY